MEIRKVQVTGGSSYIVSLPKAWINSLKIKKNDPLGIIIRQDGTLIITPSIIEEENKRVKIFETDAKTEEEFIFRSLIGAYISGYKTIKVVSKVEMPARIRMAVKEFCQITIGPEVIEETANMIITKDLLNPSEMPFDKTIQRMYILIKSMYKGVITAFVDRDPVLAKDVITNDNEVDRLHWLVMRQANLISQDIKVADKMGATIWSASHYTRVSKLFERIADHTCRIARKVLDLEDESINQSAITHEIVNASDLAINILTEGVDAFFERNIELSNDNIEKGKDLIDQCEKITDQIIAQSGRVALPLNGIIESVLRIGEYSTDLSEYVIDYLIGEEI
ncbi:PhoU family transcriptional regulator [Methanosarcinales archaeon ex4572_44]|nr:MAG: PhoU family transcriptional regulator [Methanosarcinales archaeon ex4484_138]PHP45945.1 MAG: PhoU family transcriptional regulator [Methanosarcinales archaeon ex4572_44]RLG26081.1 MAG: phosphate uptake regulator PhoU [Methanosarcinales archaeon]HHI30494.1 phosphate uptake regulator PhoU [Candidatus Methanoperedenaceae archaeon]